MEIDGRANRWLSIVDHDLVEKLHFEPNFAIASDQMYL
jgi:hypothetical protein